jgi:hypothetical protein
LLFELKKDALKVGVITATRHLGTFMCMLPIPFRK